MDCHKNTKTMFLLDFARTPNGVRDDRCRVYHWTQSSDISSGASSQGVATLRPWATEPFSPLGWFEIGTVPYIRNGHRYQQAVRSAGLGNTTGGDECPQA